MNRTDLIKAIENIKTDDTKAIEWNLEYIYVDCVANRGTRNYGLVTAYDLLAHAEIKSRKTLAKRKRLAE